MIDFLQVHGQGQRKQVTLGDGGVFPSLQVLLQVAANLLSDFREDIAGLQFRTQAAYNLLVGGRIYDYLAGVYGIYRKGKSSGLTGVGVEAPTGWRDRVHFIVQDVI